MGKKRDHGRKKVPPVNRGTPGTVSHAYPDLFPQDWKALGERLREFDTAWFEANRYNDEFAREYVPGEAYPKHDPDVRYVVVKRLGDTRVRALTAEMPPNMPFVELPSDLKLDQAEDAQEE